MKSTLVAITAAAFATLATFGASHAATTAVQTADLDLATVEGQARLDSRIDRAVRAVCSEAITGSRIAVVDKDCMAKARAAVEKQIATRRGSTRFGG
ncbi:MAG: UrcA family protein [Novosphingobium sp.]|nr:UrcA family protein [Novosphingobium sp.]